MIPGLVSVILPVYNRPRQLVEAVESVLDQTYKQWELFIVDDGSTDGETVRMANRLRAEIGVSATVLTQANGGPGVARELGRIHARGEFIQYLDSDDVLLPRKFEVQVAALASTPNANVCYGITLVRNRAGEIGRLPHKLTGTRQKHMFPEFLLARWWETATPLYRRSICDRAGAWLGTRLEEDWEYDCRIASLGGKLVYCEEPVSEHRDHPGDRLSRGEALDPQRLRWRAQSHCLVFAHALRAGLDETAKPQLATFSRSLFLLARQCRATSLETEARQLLDLARRSAEMSSGKTFDIRLYVTAHSLLGSHAMISLTNIYEKKLRRG